MKNNKYLKLFGGLLIAAILMIMVYLSPLVMVTKWSIIFIIGLIITFYIQKNT